MVQYMNGMALLIIHGTFTNMIKALYIVRMRVFLLLCSFGIREVYGCPSKCNCDRVGFVVCWGKGSAVLPKNISTDTWSLILNEYNVSEINGRHFPGLTNLQPFHIKSSFVQYVKNDTFTTMKRLVEVSLADNRISFFERGTFSNQSNLANL